MSDETKLRACQCGNKGVEALKLVDSGQYQAYCGICGRRGAWRDSPEGMATEWNTRADDDLLRALVEALEKSIQARHEQQAMPDDSGDEEARAAIARAKTAMGGGA